MTTIKSLLKNIQKNQENFAKSGQKLAEYILLHSDQVVSISISDLALKANVGEASVSRFCKQLGFNRFQDFKTALAIDVTQKEHGLEPNLSSFELSITDDVIDVASKLKNNLNTILNDTITPIKPNEIALIVDKISACRDICFFGIGSSGIAADYAYTKLMRIGLKAESLHNNHMMYIRASLLSHKDIAFFISHRGESEEIIKSISLAKKEGATTLALTHRPDSTLASIADHVLITGDDQTFIQGDSIGTMMSQLFMIDLLYTLLIQREPKKAQKVKLKTIQALK
ncbi:MurR/RpiR family transcriptional regulator [Photobacterium kishitanii]|uniref:MurR/RpiR family transcriptional regulator n=1 Tax=Photobacterium kishitanii TaxID=318456 RepID=A0A2T3KK66_9GAMM|nr:MurR/RpiR family transcriptional regulator [Photobacterium kishitanii]PSU99979.1 MurR/RpiR family transcriptional regulator [Photobacterium kishitanii]